MKSNEYIECMSTIFRAILGQAARPTNNNNNNYTTSLFVFIFSFHSVRWPLHFATTNNSKRMRKIGLFICWARKYQVQIKLQSYVLIQLFTITISCHYSEDYGKKNHCIRMQQLK